MAYVSSDYCQYITLEVFQTRKESAGGGGIFGGGTFADHKGKKGKEVLLLRLTTGIAVLFMVSSVMISIFK